jgi:hypothetical protein
MDDESANVFLQSDSIRNEGSWRASLYRDTELRASVPFTDEHVELDRAMSPGVYTIELASAGAPVARLTIALEPFSLPESLQAGEAYLGRLQYIRAAAVPSAASERYPENRMRKTCWCSPRPWRPQIQPATKKNSPSSGPCGAPVIRRDICANSLSQQKQSSEKRMASMFAGRSLDRAAISDEVIAKISQETASIVVLQVLEALKERLAAREDTSKDQCLLDALNGVTKSLEAVEVLRRELSDRIELLRHDATKSADEKFGAVEAALERFGEELANRNLRTADYEAFFVKQLGQPCWHWISRDARKIFMESENHYRHAGSRPLADEPDFTAGLLDLCRGLEMLLNEKLGTISVEIARRVLGSTQAIFDVGPALPINMRGSLRQGLEKILDKSQKKKSLGISEIALQLHIGKVAKGLLGGDAKAVLGRTPGPAVT